MSIPISTDRRQIDLGPAHITSSTIEGDSGASLVITPETVPMDFGGWSRNGRGQDFEVTFVNGDRELTPGCAVFVRVNYWIGIPDREGGSTATSMSPGLQESAPHAANYVFLNGRETEAALSLLPPMYVNPQLRIVKVVVEDGAPMRPGDRFTLRFENAFSLVGLPLGLSTDANERAFVAVIGRPAGKKGSGEAPEYAYEIVSRSRTTGGLILPLAAERVHAVAPSRVQPGVAFPLRIAVIDPEDNVATGFVGSVAVACPSNPDAVIEPGMVDFDGSGSPSASVQVTLTREGVHRVEVTLLPAGGTEAGPFCSNPVEASADGPAKLLLWGDYHSHSWRCDGTGDPSVLLDYARNGSFLDWYVLTSHDAPRWPLIGAMRWDEIAGMVETANDEGPDGGRFVTIPAFEWTSGATGDSQDDAPAGTPRERAVARTEPKTNADGHHIVLAREWKTLLDAGDDADVFDDIPACDDPGDGTRIGTDTAWKLHRTMIDERQGTANDAQFLIIPHDLLCNNWWAINAQMPDGGQVVTVAEQMRYVPLAQVYSTLHGNHESPQEDGTIPCCKGSGWRHHSANFGHPAELAGYVNGLKYGGIYGVAAGGDSHSGRPGSFRYGALTAVLTADHTRNGVFDALLARHTYATSGARLLMELSCGGAIMGDVIEYLPDDTVAPELRWRVVSPTPIRRVRLVRVRGPVPGEDLFQPMDAGCPRELWRFVEYVVDGAYDEADGRTELSGTFTDRAFPAGEWPYASYFLVVSHQGERPHGSVWSEETELEERGWTSPIFFRREGSMDGNAPGADPGRCGTVTDRVG